MKQTHQGAEAFVELSVTAQSVEKCVRGFAGTTKALEGPRLDPTDRGTADLETVLVGVGEGQAFDRLQASLVPLGGEEQFRVEDVGTDGLCETPPDLLDDG